MPEVEQEICLSPSPHVILNPPEGNIDREPPPSPEIDYFDKETAPQPPITRDLVNTEPSHWASGLVKNEDGSC